MNDVSLLQPPLAFLILLAAAGLLLFAMSRLALKPSQPSSAEPYACGEVLGSHLIRPDYGQFLPFAFFFTLLHVMALMAATVPVETAASFCIAAGYLGCALLSVYVLYSR